jgi:acetyl esterase/lipase
VPADPAAIDAILKQVLDAVPFQLTADGGVDAARARFRELPRMPILPDVTAQDRTVDGPAGPIPIRIYTPPPTGRTPAVVMYFHGGGFAVGDLDTHDGTARQHAVGADAVVVSVDYRLAPEHPYPAAVEDAWAATRWAADNGAALGADASRLAVAGDSAGGNLAAVMALLARDENGPAIAFQLLWYPTVLWDNTLPSFTENAEAPILDRSAIDAFSEWYAGHVDPANPPATLAPGRAARFDGLPPAYIAVAGHDPLRDDGIGYAERLTAAGVSVTLDHAETLVHGYLGFAGIIPATTEAMDRGLTALRAALNS